jgi:hypothetical protein
VFTFIAGIGMYGTTYLVPLCLAQVRGYSAADRPRDHRRSLGDDCDVAGQYAHRAPA